MTAHLARCKHETTREVTLDEYELTTFDVPFRTILEASVVGDKCVKCGAVVATTIRNLRSLERVVALTRVAHEQKLDGREVRFLRKTLGWQAKRLAEELLITPETLSRIEKGHRAISPKHESWLRLIVWLELVWDEPLIKVDRDAVNRIRKLKIKAAQPVAEVLEIRLVLSSCRPFEQDRHKAKCEEALARDLNKLSVEVTEGWAARPQVRCA